MESFEDLTPAQIEASIAELRRQPHDPRLDENYACEQCTGVRGSTFCTRCTGCWRCSHCTGCADCTGCTHCHDCERLHDSSHCRQSTRCARSAFLIRCEDCVDCVHCFGCVGLRGREFHIFNVKFPKKEYFNALKAMGYR